MCLSVMPPEGIIGRDPAARLDLLLVPWRGVSAATGGRTTDRSEATALAPYSPECVE
jgi:hypothetical protein